MRISNNGRRGSSVSSDVPIKVPADGSEAEVRATTGGDSETSPASQKTLTKAQDADSYDSQGGQNVMAEVTRKQMRTSMTFRFVQQQKQPSQAQSMLADMMIVNNEDYISRLSKLSKDTNQRLGTTSLQSASARRDGHVYTAFSKAAYESHVLRRAEVQTADPSQAKAKKKQKLSSGQ